MSICEHTQSDLLLSDYNPVPEIVGSELGFAQNQKISGASNPQRLLNSASDPPGMTSSESREYATITLVPVALFLSYLFNQMAIIVSIGASFGSSTWPCLCLSDASGGTSIASERVLGTCFFQDASRYSKQPKMNMKASYYSDRLYECMAGT